MITGDIKNLTNYEFYGCTNDKKVFMRLKRNYE